MKNQLIIFMENSIQQQQRLIRNERNDQSGGTCRIFGPE